ncbi:hypothetical protein K7X08_008145 [Anisodus acutangulus]|uniref:Non-specific lipid-transfer protein n=1 Tax=Anisodus acutangulus TaxID=402998 RepID=A0A9Q1MVL0_9SOLA|nr:hypothetical protein K7X08_008145 [Anisodus acutangulus]
MFQLMFEPEQALTCGQVDASLAPCIPYLTQGGEPGAACCSGVKILKGLTQSTADKKVACNCVKASANRYANLKDDAAQALPTKCGVTMDTPISRNVNCDARKAQKKSHLDDHTSITRKPPLIVPAENAIFFNGDKIEGTGNPVIERLSDLQKIAEILVSKFGNSINAWVVEAPVFNEPFAVYKDFIPSVNDYGEPKSYDADGYPASSSIVLLLWNCLKEAKNVISGKQKEPYQAEVSTSSSSTPRTLLLGFSKGGTLLNQLVTELGFAPVQLTEDMCLANKNVTNGGFASPQQDQIIPNSKDGFLNSIAEFHFVEVRLNTEGAYVTNHDVINRISERLAQGAPGIRFFLHGTPRQ